MLWPQHHSGIFRKGVLGAEPLGEPEGVLPGVVRGVAPGVRMSSLRACVSSLLSALSGTRPCTTQHRIPSRPDLPLFHHPCSNDAPLV